MTNYSHIQHLELSTRPLVSLAVPAFFVHRVSDLQITSYAVFSSPVSITSESIYDI